MNRTAKSPPSSDENVSESSRSFGWGLYQKMFDIFEQKDSLGTFIEKDLLPDICKIFMEGCALCFKNCV